MYAELSYFEGYHFQHIAAWQEGQRLARIRSQTGRILRERRRNSRCI
jgi:hypothetical protein